MRWEIPEDTPTFLRSGGEVSEGLTDLGRETETERGGTSDAGCGEGVLRSSIVLVSSGLETLRGFLTSSGRCSLVERGKSGMTGDLDTRTGFASWTVAHWSSSMKESSDRD